MVHWSAAIKVINHVSAKHFHAYTKKYNGNRNITIKWLKYLLYSLILLKKTSSHNFQIEALITYCLIHKELSAVMLRFQNFYYSFVNFYPFSLWNLKHVHTFFHVLISTIWFLPKFSYHHFGNNFSSLIKIFKTVILFHGIFFKRLVSLWIH